MKKILVGFIMNGKAGGLDRYLLNFLETVQEDNVQLDFLTNKIDEELKGDLAKRHVGLYAIDRLIHPVRQFKQVCHIIKKGNYDTIYLNISTAIDCIAAFAAKRMRVPERIIHSHSSGNDCQNVFNRMVYNFIHKVCRMFLYKAGTKYCGCSKKAGYWLFPSKIVNSPSFEVIYNAVDRNDFFYSKALRTEVRREMGLEDKFVVGHLGNFCYAKNYPFLIRVFQEIYVRKKNACLLLAGTGVEFRAVKEMVKELGLEEAVQFLGWCKDTSRLYHGMDIFILPSRFEGLPITGVEAQCTKLATVFSDSITEEAKIADHCYFLNTQETPKEWARFILEKQNYNREDVCLLESAVHYDLAAQRGQLKRLVCR